MTESPIRRIPGAWIAVALVSVSILVACTNPYTNPNPNEEAAAASHINERMERPGNEPGAQTGQCNP